jgi:hypothetical protein
MNLGTRRADKISSVLFWTRVNLWPHNTASINPQKGLNTSAIAWREREQDTVLITAALFAGALLAKPTVAPVTIFAFGSAALLSVLILSGGPRWFAATAALILAFLSFAVWIPVSVRFRDGTSLPIVQAQTFNRILARTVDTLDRVPNLSLKTVYIPVIAQYLNADGMNSSCAVAAYLRHISCLCISPAISPLIERRSIAPSNYIVFRRQQPACERAAQLQTPGRDWSDGYGVRLLPTARNHWHAALSWQDCYSKSYP